MKKPLVGKVDDELVEGVRAGGEVLGAREVEETNKGGEIIFAEFLVDMLVQPGEEEGIEGFGEIISVIRCTIRIEENSAKLLLDELGLV
jgi:hypothetical protein